MTPDLTELLVEGDNPVHVKALYTDVLVRVLGGSEDFAFDVFCAWEICKDLQRIRRIGTHPLADQAVRDISHRATQRAEEWEEVDHRTRARRQVLASVQSLIDLHSALVPGRAAKGTGKLKVVG